MPSVNLMVLKTETLASSALPGQFVMISADNTGSRLLKRPISIHRVQGDQLHLLFAAVGAGTNWLAQRLPGDKLDILGPLGNSFTLPSGSGNLLLAAGGMGIAPLVFLADKAVSQGISVRLLAGAKTAGLLLDRTVLSPNIEYLTVTEDGTQGERGLITGLLQQQAQWADRICICGPLPMYKAIAREAESLLGGKPTQVSLEVRMGCGIGICYSCTVRTSHGLKQVCKDGPVFDMTEIDWAFLK
jgi:dihydroorotate dehydrogenase electron transfer subunit